MAEHPRIEDLRRRVQKDPASIAFAQLAEECRRAGHFQEAVETCRAGLQIHPGYLSARVTLGRALIELNDLDDALAELELVLKSAAENLSAIRGVAEIHHRRGDLPKALEHYRAALVLARNDPDLERTVEELAKQIDPAPAPRVIHDGLSLEQMQEELFKLAPPPKPVPAPAPAPAAAPVPAAPIEAPEIEPASSQSVDAGPVIMEETVPSETAAAALLPAEHLLAERTIAALESFAAAIHVARANRDS